MAQQDQKGFDNRTEEMVAESLEILGGTAYLVEQGIKNPDKYMALIGKLVAKKMQSQVNITVSIADELNRLRDADRNAIRRKANKTSE